MIKGAIRAGILLAAVTWFMDGSLRAQDPDEMAVVTFNVRYDNPGDPLTWEQRRDQVVAAIGYFDILGFQEALANQVADLAAGLPEHDHYGVGRDDGIAGGEHCPIFWRRDRFDLLHAETKWLFSGVPWNGQMLVASVTIRIVMEYGKNCKSNTQTIPGSPCGTSPVMVMGN